MHDVLTTMVPLLLFMLIPVIIPVVAVACGALMDLVAPKPVPVRVGTHERR